MQKLASGWVSYFYYYQLTNKLGMSEDEEIESLMTHVNIF